MTQNEIEIKEQLTELRQQFNQIIIVVGVLAEEVEKLKLATESEPEEPAIWKPY